MPLTIPSRKSLTQSIRAYLLSSVPEWDTSTERRSLVGGLAKSLSSGLHDWYVSLKRFTDTDAFPQTATGQYLTQGWWADITKLTPNPATPAQGKVVFTGSAGTNVPATTALSVNGFVYTVDHDVSIVAQSIAVALTFAGGIVTATSASPHLLATGQSVAISGAAQSPYNGTFTIIVTGDYTFTYVIAGSPTSPATGSPLAGATFASASLTCKSTGPDGNLDSGATLQLSSSIPGVGNTALVGFGGVGGGADIESPDAYRQRVLFALGTDFGTFTADEIEIVVRQIPGVTRVWVRTASATPADGWPGEGQVFVAFMRDNDPSPFPTSLEVNAVHDHIMTVCAPANTSPDDVVVTSPTPQTVNFLFSALSPDTPTMRAAIQANLAQFFVEGVDYGANVLQDDYRAAIRDTYDPQTRTRLKSFSLSSPSGDIAVGATSLPILGTVS